MMGVYVESKNLFYHYMNEDGQAYSRILCLNITGCTIGAALRAIGVAHTIKDGTYEVDANDLTIACVNFLYQPQDVQVASLAAEAPYKNPEQELGLIASLLAIAANRLGAGDKTLTIG